MNIEEINKNSKILINAVPFAVENVEFVKPGKGQGIYKLKLRNLLNGAALQQTYRSGDRLDEARIGVNEMQYLYQEGDQFIFMDSVTFEQHSLSQEQVGQRKYFFKEGMPVTMLMLDDKPIDIQLPLSVEMKVLKSEASTKTQTVTAQMKRAVTDTGLEVDVPTFVKEGDNIKVDTRTGNYIERVTGK